MTDDHLARAREEANAFYGLRPGQTVRELTSMVRARLATDGPWSARCMFNTISSTSRRKVLIRLTVEEILSLVEAAPDEDLGDWR